VNFGPLTLEFKKSADQQFGYAEPLLDIAEISTEFSGVIATQFCFTYAPEDVTAMSRGLHARLCHAFLVSIIIITNVILLITIIILKHNNPFASPFLRSFNSRAPPLVALEARCRLLIG